MIEPDRPTNDSWQMLRNLLSTRLSLPLRQVSFVSYLLTIVVILGGLGVIVELVKLAIGSSTEWAGLLTAIYTYFPALAGGAAFQMICDEEKYVRSFSLFCLVIIAGIAMLQASGIFGEHSFSLAFGMIGVIASILLWWVANGANPTYNDMTPIDTIGGAPHAPAQGDLSGFTT